MKKRCPLRVRHEDHIVSEKQKNCNLVCLHQYLRRLAAQIERWRHKKNQRRLPYHARMGSAYRTWAKRTATRMSQISPTTPLRLRSAPTLDLLGWQRFSLSQFGVERHEVRHNHQNQLGNSPPLSKARQCSRKMFLTQGGANCTSIKRTSDCVLEKCC